MDELWQRYRAFWTPVLWGVGVFLLGLIVVHVLTDDPEIGIRANDVLAVQIKNRTTPSPTQFRGAGTNADELHKHVTAWAARLDQRHGDDTDLLAAAVGQALRAAVLRGAAPGDASAFDGDPAAALAAKQRYDQIYPARLALLRTQDPNIGFSMLQSDVVRELEVWANREDVDVTADDFGFGSISSVDRANLTRYVANLALVATFSGAAIRAGVRSIDRVEIVSTEAAGRGGGSEGFLTEWPVVVEATGDPRALLEVLAMLTDPARPTALGLSTWKVAGADAERRKAGLVRATMKLYSLRVQPDVNLGLETEAE